MTSVGQSTGGIVCSIETQPLYWTTFQVLDTANDPDHGFCQSCIVERSRHGQDGAVKLLFPDANRCFDTYWPFQNEVSNN